MAIFKDKITYAARYLALASLATSLLVLSSCGGGGGGGGGGNTSVAPGNMSAVGGTVTDASGASITVPQGALMSKTANVAITSTPQTTGTPMQVSIQGSATSVSKQYTLSQDSGFNFTAPVTVTLPYDTTGLTASDVLAAAYYDTALDKWVPISNGVDNRAEGTFTFTTLHFTLFAMVRVQLSLPPQAYQTLFNPADDGIPIKNFSVAISPDNTTYGKDGNCAGMVELAGWYYKYKKPKTGVDAATFFTDSVATRRYIDQLQSGLIPRTIGSKLVERDVNDSQTPITDSAALAIRKAIYGTQAPVLALVKATDSKGNAFAPHYVLIYEYDTSSFKYYDPNIPYDPNYPGSEVQIIETDSSGQLKNWKVGGDGTQRNPDGTVVNTYSVNKFNLFYLVDDTFKQPELENYYSSFISGCHQGICGNFVNLQATLPASDRVDVTGSVSTDTHLAGMPLYVHFTVPANRVVAAQNYPPNAKVEISPDQQLSVTPWSALPVGSFVAGAPAAFAASFSTSKFTSGPPVTLTVTVSTEPLNFQTVVWAYDEVTLPQIPPTSVCTAPQTLVNGQCVTPTSTCTSPQILQNGVCVTPTPTCTAPQVLQGTQCVTPPTVCTAPQTLVNGQCVTPTPTCTSPQVLQNGVCVTPTPTCTLPQVLTNGVCVTPTPTLAPTVQSLAATLVTATTVQTNGSINPNGLSTSAYFEIGTTTGYGSTSTGTGTYSGTSAVPIYIGWTGLTPNTTYHYRAVATNSAGTSRGSDVTFTTAAVTTAPTVQSLAATLVTATTAQMNGSINPNGLSTSAYFEYGTTTSYGSTLVVPTFSGTSAVPIYSNGWTGLTPNTTYHYRAVATNSAGTSRGSDVTFTTAAVTTAPTVQSLAATLVTATTAQTNGSINPNGLSTSTYFEIGTTTGYGSTSTGTGTYSGTSAVPIYTSWTGLTPNTTYHYRAVATNSAGTSRGSDVTFTTAGSALPAGYVVQGGLTWMPVTFQKNWADANAYCATTTINGQSGWRLPTVTELNALYASGAMNGQGWTLSGSYIWSSNWSPNSWDAGSHYGVYLAGGGLALMYDMSPFYMTCVR